MNRTRAIALGLATLGVALGTGALVQRMAPQDHPARAQGAGPAVDAGHGAGTALPEIPAQAITPLAADVGPVVDGNGPAGWDAVGRAPGTLGEMMPGLAGALAEGGRIAAEAVPRLIEMVPPEVRAERMAELSPDPAGNVDAAGGIAALEPVDCTPRLALAPAPAAMIDLAFDAPCDPEARVVVTHAGLAVTARTSAQGGLDLRLPALTAEAEVALRLDGGPATSGAVTVPDLDLYDRVAVQWQREDAFQLHAFEFGAEPGAPGHVSAANPAGPERALGGTGGFLTLLGDSTTDWPLLAEVYSFPAGRIAGLGAVELSLEAAITPETCGRELLGETLEMRRGGPVTVTEIFVAMPDCDATGGYVLLKNLLADLTLARN